MEYGCYHCIVAEKDPEKLRMIRRRLSKEKKKKNEMKAAFTDLSYY